MSRLNQAAASTFPALQLPVGNINLTRVRPRSFCCFLVFFSLWHQKEPCLNFFLWILLFYSSDVWTSAGLKRRKNERSADSFSNLLYDQMYVTSTITDSFLWGVSVCQPFGAGLRGHVTEWHSCYCMYHLWACRQKEKRKGCAVGKLKKGI